MTMTMTQRSQSHRTPLRIRLTRIVITTALVELLVLRFKSCVLGAF